MFGGDHRALDVLKWKDIIDELEAAIDRLEDVSDVARGDRAEARLMPLWLVLVLAYVFEFANGWTDAPNSIATVVSTRVLRPHHAVLMAGALNLVGALTGTAVAKTIAEGIVDPEFVTLTTIGAAVLAATIWALGAQYFGLPSSESHAIIAALLGAGFAVRRSGSARVIGRQEGAHRSRDVAARGLLHRADPHDRLIYRLFAKVRKSTVSRVFGKAQIASAAFMAFSHGTNDAQKTMGIIALALFLNKAGTPSAAPNLTIELWIILSCGLVIGVGTMVGGWRVVRTLGLRMTKLEPVQGFAAETGAALVITGAARLGIPVSTTHAIGSSIMGVGATKRFSAVRWGVARAGGGGLDPHVAVLHGARLRARQGAHHRLLSDRRVDRRRSALVSDRCPPIPSVAFPMNASILPELPESRFLNRELSWLEFNARVLALAEDPGLPVARAGEVPGDLLEQPRRVLPGPRLGPAGAGGRRRRRPRRRRTG